MNAARRRRHGSGRQARALVTVRGVSKQFSNGTLAVRDVDLDLRAGRVRQPARALRLRQIDPAAHDRRPRRAERRRDRLADGASTTRAGNAERDLGFVFQEPTLMPWATALDNVTLPLRLQGRERGEAEDARGGDAGARRPRRLREVLSARALRRHEDARLDRPRARDRAARSC